MYDVIVLGSNGQLGMDLMESLKEANLNVLGLTRNEINALESNLDTALEQYSTRYLVNCIATTNVDGCEINSGNAFLINSSFVLQLARYAQKKDIIIFHISTDYVFDGKTAYPYIETDSPNPQNAYGLSKYAGEIALRSYHDKYFIFRTSSLFGKYGASGKGGNFITTMQKLAKEKDSISVISDQYMCPTSTTSVAKCITHFITEQNDDYGVYHCVSTTWCSWFDFACAVFKHSKLDTNILSPTPFDHYLFKAKRPKFSALSVIKLSKYYIMPSWERSLSAYFTETSEHALKLQQNSYQLHP